MANNDHFHRSASQVAPHNWALVNTCLFIVLGSSAALGWNSLANSLNAAQKVLFPEKPALSGYVVAAYNASVLISSVLLLSMNLTGLQIMIGGFTGTATLGVLFQVFAMKITSSLLSPVLLITAVVLGIFAAIAISSTFALASVTATPDESSTGASAGLGMSGAISFICWIFFSHMVWDASDREQLEKIMFALCAVQIVVCVAAVVCTCAAIRHVGEQIVEASQAAGEAEPLTPPLTPYLAHQGFQSVAAVPGAASPATLQRQPTRAPPQEVLKQIMPSFLALLIGSMVSFCLYPTIWPYQLPLPITDGDLVVGVFQFGDLTGRLMPLLVPPLSVAGSVALMILRFVFLPVGLLLYERPHLVNLGVALLVTGLLALTNGLIGTAGAVNAAAAVQGPTAKRTSAALGTTAMVTGVASGSALAAVAASFM